MGVTLKYWRTRLAHRGKWPGNTFCHPPAFAAEWYTSSAVRPIHLS